MADLEVETSDGVPGAKKRFFGVTKQRNKWRARVRDPMLKVDVELGCYRTPEEASLAVQKKKAEFEEMLKGADSLSMRTCRGYFKRKKRPIPRGVLFDNGMYRVHLRHPTLKKMVSGGSYKTCEEAVDAANKKREEFQKMLAGTLRVTPDNEEDNEVFQKPESLSASKSGCSEGQTGDEKVPSEATRINSGKLAVTVKKPDYSTLEEAINSFDKKKAECHAKLKKPEFDRVEANETPMKFESEFGYDCPTSLSDAYNLKNFALCGNTNCDWEIVGDGLVDISATSVFDPRNLNNVSDSDKSCDSDFDRAVSLGIINEYGQLLGKYSESDKYMRLSS